MFKKTIINIILFVLLTFLICSLLWYGCSSLLINTLYDDLGSRDWQVQLPHGYYIQQIHRNRILLTKDLWSETSDIVVDRNIAAYCYSDRFIGIMCAKTGDSYSSNRHVFYLVDMHQKVLFGPFDDTEYQNLCNDNKFEESKQWIYTIPRPSSATYS